MIVWGSRRLSEGQGGWAPFSLIKKWFGYGTNTVVANTGKHTSQTLTTLNSRAVPATQLRSEAIAVTKLRTRPVPETE